jgi:hypothetical protein
VGVMETAARSSRIDGRVYGNREDNLRAMEGSEKTSYEPPSRPAASIELQTDGEVVTPQTPGTIGEKKGCQSLSNIF